jgi:hypothetical protein
MFLFIYSGVVIIGYLSSIFYTIRKSILELYDIYGRRTGHQPISVSVTRTIPAVLREALLPIFRKEFENQLTNFLCYEFQRKHFFVNHFFPPNRSNVDAKKYSLRIRHLLFGLTHQLTALAVVIFFLRIVFTSREDIFSCGEHDGSALACAERALCSWNEIHGNCEFVVSAGSRSGLQYGFTLIFLSFLFSVVMVPFHGLLFCVVDMLEHFYIFYLFTLSNKYSKDSPDQSLDPLVVNNQIQNRNHVSTDLWSIKPKESPQTNILHNDNGHRIIVNSNDEFWLLQTHKSMLFRAIRLVVLQRRIDYVRAFEEIDFLLNSCKVPNHFIRWKQIPETFESKYNWINNIRYICQIIEYHLYTMCGNPHEIQKFLTHTRINYPNLILNQILTARTRSLELYNHFLISFPADNSRKACDYYEIDLQILQYFLTYWFNGLSQEILKLQYLELTQNRQKEVFLSCLFQIPVAEVKADNDDNGEGSSSRDRTSALSAVRTYGVYLSNLEKFGYLTLMTLFVIFVSLEIAFIFRFIWYDDGDSLEMILLFFITNFVYVLLIAPSVIGLHSVFLPQFVAQDYLALFQCIEKKFRFLLTKKHGYLKNIFSTIQFFHPAVRLARMMPSSAISRILISLHDFDLPVDKILENKKPQKQDYKIRYNIWTELNPLIVHRCSLLYDNWCTRISFFFWVVKRGMVRLLRLFFFFILILPSYIRSVVSELLFIGYFYGFPLLILYYWNQKFVIAILFIFLFILAALIFLNIIFRWTERLSRYCQERFRKANENVLKYKKKSRKKPVKVFEKTKVFSGLEDEEETREDGVV